MLVTPQFIIDRPDNGSSQRYYRSFAAGRRRFEANFRTRPMGRALSRL